MSNMINSYDGIFLSTPLHVVYQKRTMDVIYAPAAKDSSLFPVSFTLQYRIEYMAWKLTSTLKLDKQNHV